MFLLASISFWTVRAQGIVWGYYNLFNIARMPDEAFRGLFKAVFTFALPMLLVSNVPVRLLVDKLQSPLPVLLLLGMSAGVLRGFRMGLARLHPPLHQRQFVTAEFKFNRRERKDTKKTNGAAERRGACSRRRKKADRP